MKLEIILLDKQAQKYKKEMEKMAGRLADFLPKKGEIDV